jgi:hypothetical protein
LDGIAEDGGELHLAARSIAADLLADYGQPDNRLLKADGSIAFGLLEPGYQDPDYQDPGCSTGKDLIPRRSSC